MTACSATVPAFTPAQLHTAMPRARAASTSIALKATPLRMDELEIRHSFDKPHINRAYGVGDDDGGIGRSSKQIVVRGAPFGAHEIHLARNRQVRQILARARLAPNGQNQHVNPLSTITASRYSKPIHCQYGTQTTSPARQVAR